MFAAFLILTVATAAQACPAEPPGYLMTRTYDAFDASTEPDAWRSLLNRGCVDAAVATLQAYALANNQKMTPEQRLEAHFHMGQALAMSGREQDALTHFEAAGGPGSTGDWSAYVDAHIAFVRKDRPRLEEALKAYERLAPPTSMRLRFIRGFLTCLDRPYMEAAHCAM